MNGDDRNRDSKLSVTYLCMNRHGAREALGILLAKGVDVCSCICEELPPNELSELCAKNRIRVYNYAQAEAAMKSGSMQKTDYAISYLYHKVVKPDMIGFFDGRIINFHPAPVQIHRGCSACTYCLLNGCREWASTAHYLSEGVDEGDVICQRWYPVPDGKMTAIEFEKIAQEETLCLFETVVDMLIRGEALPRKRQDPGVGVYYSRRDLMADKDIDMGMKSEEIDRRIAALWFPPYHGASIVIDGKRYSLVNQELMTKLADLYAGVHVSSRAKGGC